MKRIASIADRRWATRAILCIALGLFSTAAWAQGPAPQRFADNGDGTVSDGLTGLMWEKAPSTEKMYWPHSQTYVEAMTLAGYDDWRLPSMTELESLARGDHPDYASWLNSQGFTDIQPFDYWTGKLLQYMGYEEVDHTYGYVVSMHDGGFNTWLIWGEINYVWAVRGPQWRGEQGD